MTAVAYENDTQEAWAEEFRSEHAPTMSDVLDGGAAYREREKAHVQTRAQREQDQIAAQRAAVKALREVEAEVSTGYETFGATLATFVDEIEGLTALRRAYDLAWHRAKSLGVEPLPLLLPSIPIAANRDTEDALLQRQLLTRFRVACATPLP